MAEPITEMPSAPPEYVEYDREIGGVAVGAVEVELPADVPPVEQPEGAIVPDEPRTEAERLVPDPSAPFSLESGTMVRIIPMRTIETMKLLRIVTHGAGGFVTQMVDGLNIEDGAAFAQSLATVLIMSIPDATVETIDFVQSMCVPDALDKITDKKARREATDSLEAELANPSLDDLITVVERIIRRESEDIRALGKRLSAALNWAARANDLVQKNEATQKD